MLPRPDTNLEIHDQPDHILLPMMLVGEAEGEPTYGKLAVAEVAQNRANREAHWNRGPEEWSALKRSILRPWQFSAFNKDSPRLTVMMNPPSKVWEECYHVAQVVLQAQPWKPLAGIAKGADFYHATWLYGAKRKPAWLLAAMASDTPRVTIGNHVFWELGPDGIPNTRDDLV